VVATTRMVSRPSAYKDFPVATGGGNWLPKHPVYGILLYTRCANLSFANLPDFRHKGYDIAEGRNTMLRKLLLAASLFSVAGAPVAAQAASRHASPVSAKENIAGVGTLGIVITLAVVVGLVLIVSHDNKHKPASP